MLSPGKKGFKSLEVAEEQYKSLQILLMFRKIFQAMVRGFKEECMTEVEEMLNGREMHEPSLSAGLPWLVASLSAAAAVPAMLPVAPPLPAAAAEVPPGRRPLSPLHREESRLGTGGEETRSGWRTRANTR